MTIYGFARVSTDGQSLAAQQRRCMVPGVSRSLPRRLGAPAWIVPSWAKLLKALGEGTPSW